MYKAPIDVHAHTNQAPPPKKKQEEDLLLLEPTVYLTVCALHLRSVLYFIRISLVKRMVLHQMPPVAFFADPDLYPRPRAQVDFVVPDLVVPGSQLEINTCIYMRRAYHCNATKEPNTDGGD